MGRVYAELKLVNATDHEMSVRGLIPADQVRQETVTAQVDSGADDMVINQALCRRLGLRVEHIVPATLAGGIEIPLEIASPMLIFFENRDTVVKPMVVQGDEEVLLGHLPMQGMDVVINMKEERLTVNPASPHTKMMMLK